MGAPEKAVTVSFLSGRKQTLWPSRSWLLGRCSCRTRKKKPHWGAEATQAQKPTAQYRGRKGKFRYQGRKKAGRSWASHSSFTSVGRQANLQDLAGKNSLGFRPEFATYSRRVAHSLSLRVRIMNEMISRGNINIL